jgi:hypothetical protein
MQGVLKPTRKEAAAPAGVLSSHQMACLHSFVPSDAVLHARLVLSADALPGHDWCLGENALLCRM